MRIRALLSSDFRSVLPSGFSRPTGLFTAIVPKLSTLTTRRSLAEGHRSTCMFHDGTQELQRPVPTAASSNVR